MTVWARWWAAVDTFCEKCQSAAVPRIYNQKDIVPAAPASPNDTIISTPDDPPLVDSHGVVWRIAENGRVMANGVLDEDRERVRHLAYVNRLICRQTADLKWSSKASPEQAWTSLTLSPVPGATAQQTGDIEAALATVLGAINLLSDSVVATTDAVVALSASASAGTAAQAASTQQILGAIASLRADVDGSHKQTALTLAQVQSSITRAQTDLDSRENALSALVTSTSSALTAQMETVLAAVKSLTAPASLAVDFAHATHKPQAIPPRG